MCILFGWVLFLTVIQIMSWICCGICQWYMERKVYCLLPFNSISLIGSAANFCCPQNFINCIKLSGFRVFTAVQSTFSILLGSDAASFGRRLRKFRRDTLPLSSICSLFVDFQNCSYLRNFVNWSAIQRRCPKDWIRFEAYSSQTNLIVVPSPLQILICVFWANKWSN